MRSVYSFFKGDKNLEAKDGIDISYGDMGSITIRRAGGANLEYQRVARERLAPFERSLALGTVSDEEARKVMIEIYADTIIIGWTLVDEEGKKIPFNRENVIKVMTDLPDLFSDISEYANKRTLFVQKKLEEKTGK